MMKEVLIIVFILMAGNSVFTQDNKPIKLNEPDLSRGLTYMQTLSVRASVKEFDTTTLSLQDLSDLLWAANGINRPDEKKRTAPSAMNAQDIDVYVFFKYGIYLYDAMNSQLNFIAAGDYRYMIAGRQEKVAKAPVICLLVSDISRFRAGSDSLRHEWANIDAGIVSQNLYQRVST